MSETLATYIDRWISKAASGGLRNPLLKMPVKRFRLLEPGEVEILKRGRGQIIGTSSDPIARNLYKNYDEKIRERGEHTGFVTHGSIEVVLAGATASGGKRSALMPVWLQRIEIRKQRENIVAQPSEEAMWDLNPELGAILQPLGIEAKKGPSESCLRLLEWLSVQVGNRGKVDTQSSFVGCFSSQHLVVRERLADSRWRRAFAQNDAVKAKLFGADVVPFNGSESASANDRAIEDLGLALPIDDSQLRVIQLADSGQSLVVQGPPGTGKSQTIANLVANALWRGKRVLVVCDKRTAIRQVEERLVKCNLGPALLNLHDEGLDKKAFLQQAVDTFPVESGSLNRFPVAALAQVRDELNQRVVDGQTIAHSAIGISRQDAVAGLIRLRKTLKNAPSVNISNWQSLSSERLNRLLSCLTEWESLSSVAANRDLVWSRVQWHAFRADPNARVEVLAAIESLSAALERLTELQEAAAIVGFNSTFEDFSSVRQLSAIAQLVAVRPKCHATILDDSSLSLSHLDQLEKSLTEMTSLAKKGHPVILKSGPSAAFRSQAEMIIDLEQLSTWGDLIKREDRHKRQLADLTSLDSAYLSIAGQSGWIPQKSRSQRIAQLVHVKELLDTQIAIPTRWWSQGQGSPAAEVMRWRREIESLTAHARNAPVPLDLAALARVPDAIWPHFQMIAEDGFNVVSYCLRFRNDRRVKLVLKQIYPQLPNQGKRPWLDLVLHALKAHEILKEANEAAHWHVDLKKLTEACFSQSIQEPNFLAGENLSRFELIHRAAAQTEQLRLRNDLFAIDSPIWSSQWESSGLRQATLINECLNAWKGVALPKDSDDVEHSRIWWTQRIELIGDFLKRHLTAEGNLGLQMLEAWDDAITYSALEKKLEEFTRYRQITDASPECVNWTELRRVIQWRNDFRDLRGSRILDADHSSWSDVRLLADRAISDFESGLNELERFFLGTTDEGQNFAALSTRLRTISSGMPLLEQWCRKAEWTAKLNAWPELEAFWARIVEGTTTVNRVKPLFCYNLLRLTNPQVAPNGQELDVKLRTFKLQDEQLEKWSISELRLRLAKRQEDAQSRHRKDFGELKRLAGLSRISGTVRQLCDANLALLLDLKRAWLMSPISLANLMNLERLAEAGQPFDLVIFDEASQIPVTEGLLPLGFAKQTIIVGDDKQLPPTSFFSTTTHSEDEEPEELGESESLIEEFSGALPAPMLMAHYRSETPDLISFSNREFYDGKLEMYPPSKVTGLGRRYHLVSEGAFDSGRTRTNLHEAKAVVKLVEEHVKLHSQHSLGVVAMNAEQMDLIESLLVTASSQVRDFCADEEKFFIRNLETVQGDEMDRIIISLTYGKSPEGRFTAAFLGPLVRKGGHRRLNVALSRSRTGMTIVTSMTVADLAQSEAQSRGFVCLKRLLEELETVNSHSTFGISHKRFDKLQDGGISQVVYCESPFEEQVVEFLENRGLEVRCQYGVQRPDGLGSFRIDIVVIDNGSPILAVECDGAAYHRSLSARTRDRARQTQLERLGWRFHRVWSTNWWLFAESEQSALLAAITEAQRQHAPSRHGPALGAVHTIPVRADVPSDATLITKVSTSQPAIEAPPALAPRAKRSTLDDELGELFKADVTPSRAVHPTQSTRARGNEGLPSLLQDWSRRPDWPESVVGKRLQWAGSWGVVTKIERDGKSVFFREEGSGETVELSADFIRMRSSAKS